MQFSIVNGPQNGQLGEINQENGTVSYTPNENFTGSDTFTYKVNDGTVDSPEATVTVDVQALPNKPPTAEAVSDTVVQDQSKDIALKASDSDVDDKLQFSIVNGPQNGQLGEINQENGTVSYTPNENFTGSDTFTYKVNDGTVDSPEATVTVDVQALPNKPPTAEAVSDTVVQDQSKDIALKASDPDVDDKLQFSIVNGPQNGQLGEINQENGTVSYTPNENFTGSDTFTYKVNDGTVDSPEATVTVDVQALPNKPPTAEAVSDTVVQDQSKDIALKASDPDVDDKLQFSIVNGPQNGQLGEINQENGTVSYTPNENFTGSDTFTYKVNDGTVDSPEATVTVDVQALPNKPPTAEAVSDTVVQDQSKDIALKASYPDVDDKLQFSIVNGPQNGQLGEINQENGTVSYTPNENFTGSDTFTYKVNDGTVDSPEATVTVDVQALPNKPPTAEAVSDTVVQDQSKDIALKASDPDVDDKLQFSIVNGPQNGQLGEINQENGTVSYTPNENFTGSDTFTYKVNDGTVDSPEATVTVDVQALPNKPPTAEAVSDTVVQDQSKDIALKASDPDVDDKLQFSIVNGPQNGQLGEINQENGTVSYTPNENFTGSDTFTYKVNDGTVDSPEATVTVDVQALPNKPPTAEAVSDTVVQDQSKDIALKASDPDVDDKLQFSIVNGPQNGQLGEINQENGTVSYTPNENFTGSDTFTYKVNDGTVDSEPATVSITVQTPGNIPTEQQKPSNIPTEQQKPSNIPTEQQKPSNIPTEQQKDKDNDGIKDLIDASPDSPSSEFSTTNKLSFGKIVEKGDQQLIIEPGLNNTQITITALPAGGKESAVIEACGHTTLILYSKDTQIINCQNQVREEN